MFSVKLTKQALSGKFLAIGPDHAGNGHYAIRRSRIANDAILASVQIAQEALKLGAGDVREVKVTFESIITATAEVRAWEPTALYTRIPGKGARYARLYRSKLGEVTGIDVTYVELLQANDATVYGPSIVGPFQECQTVAESDWLVMPVKVEDIVPLLGSAIVGADPPARVNETAEVAA